MAAVAAPSNEAANSSANTSNSIPMAMPSTPSSSTSSTHSHSMSRTTSSPLPDMANLPDDFIDHLVLVTAGLANSLPPPAIRRFLETTTTYLPTTNGSNGAAGAGAGWNSAGGNQSRNFVGLPHQSSTVTATGSGNGNGNDQSSTAAGIKYITRQTEEMNLNQSSNSSNQRHGHSASFSSAFEDQPAPPSPRSDYETADGHISEDTSTNILSPSTSSLNPSDESFASASTPTPTNSGLPQASQPSPQPQLPNNAHYSDPGSEGVVSIPLPRFHFDGGDSRTQEIEANIGRLVERLWRAEDKLESIALASRRGSTTTDSGDSVGTAKEEGVMSNSRSNSKRNSVDVEVQTATSSIAGLTSPSSANNPSNLMSPLSSDSAKEINSSSSTEATDNSSVNSNDKTPLSFFRNFPYPLSHAHPQSSTYPLSYPLGMGSDGPVLLTSGGDGTGPEGAVGAFERYSDESGLSAQEELRLLKAQVQDIARVCKVSRRVVAFHVESSQ